VLVLGLGVGALIARQLARPVARLDSAVRRISAGDLGARALVEGSSEQRSLAESFNQMAERLSDALSAQRRFVADASHQLRTPLTGLRLRIEEAQAVGVSPAAEAELDAGLREVDRLSQMVDELLVLSRAGERGSAAAEVIPLAGAADRALERWRPTAEEHGIVLERLPDKTPAAIQCYPPDLDRALDSLVENAIHYSGLGGEVQLAVSRGSIDVLDRGHGLAPGEEDAVFERFHRGQAGRTGRPGTGLGLAIARELARRWGGDAALAQRPGGGVRATLTYPVLDIPTEGGDRHAAEPVT
jgi:signal transduction histidine kinase